jgi:hypothetical protein
MPMRKYVPTDRDREVVLRMAAIPGVTREDIAFCITNERTGRRINRRTLEKHFAAELQTGMAVMKEITMNSFVEQIRAHVWSATRLALANYCGLKDGADVAVTANNISPHINVSFVPSPHANESIPADLNIDLEPNPPPHLQLPKRDAYALDAPPEPAPVVSKPEQPQYRTELDTPEGQLSLVPWHKRPLTGRIPVAGRKY